MCGGSVTGFHVLPRSVVTSAATAPGGISWALSDPMTMQKARAQATLCGVSVLTLNGGWPMVVQLVPPFVVRSRWASPLKGAVRQSLVPKQEKSFMPSLKLDTGVQVTPPLVVVRNTAILGLPAAASLSSEARQCAAVQHDTTKSRVGGTSTGATSQLDPP